MKKLHRGSFLPQKFNKREDAKNYNSNFYFHLESRKFMQLMWMVLIQNCSVHCLKCVDAFSDSLADMTNKQI